MNTSPDVGLQEASVAIAEHLGNKHRLPSHPAPQRSVQCIQVLRPRDRLAEHRPSAKQTVGGNVALLRPTWHVNTVVLEVHVWYNCKYLLICKDDEIEDTFWKFTLQLPRANQTGDAVGLSQLLFMAFLQAFQT